jgi:hypothetical protein
MHAIERGIDGIIEACDSVGIDQLCVNYAGAPEMRLGNDVVADAMRRYPERVIGVAWSNLYETPEAQVSELKRCFDELGFRGMKVIDTRGGFYPQSPSYFEEDDPLRASFEFAQERGSSILCHGYVTYEIARRYPGANFIVAHGSAVPEFCIKLAELPNTYCDISATTMLAGTIELLCEKIGAERVLYGSDLPASDVGQRLGVVMAAEVSEAEKELILGQNMKRLMANAR